MTIRYTKHGDTWGLSSEQALTPGQQVTVTKRDGSTKNEIVGALLARTEGRFASFIHAIQQAPRAAAPASAAIGSLDGVFSLFERAKAKAKKLPVVRLVADRNDCGEPTLVIRISVCGPKSRHPGSLTIEENVETDWQSGERRPWFGYVHASGAYEPARAANGSVAKITDVLRQFASEPAKVATQHAKWMGRCIFCAARIGEGDDQRSIAVGYGPDCASRWGLPWGQDKALFVAEEVI